MALLQIAEPELAGTPHKHNLAVGIDLGTTNSLIATVKSGEAVVLEMANGKKLIPSVVHYAKDVTTVGSDAQPKQLIDPANTIVSVKRFMGYSFSDLDQEVTYPYKFVDHPGHIKIRTAAGIKDAVQVSADILASLKNLAYQSLGEEPVGAVITVPAYFNDAQRQATKQAATLAGINVLRLLNEPTAAAIAYGLEHKPQGTFLVYDLGGGTFDVSILRLHNGVFEVLAVSGDTHLGGDDFDQRLFCYILEKSNLAQLSDEDSALLLVKAKQAKELLATQEKVVFNAVLSNEKIVNLTITRSEFAFIVNNLVQKTILFLKKALRDANLAKEAIDEIIMVGGSTRLLPIRLAVTDFFAKQPLTSINPDEVVAIGASLQANVLAGNSKEDWLLLDVTPLSLGVETMGGLVEKIIPRNSTIPIARAQDFTTYKDGQTAMTIHVLQGERELVDDCRSLAKFTLKGIPAMVAGQARVRITYQIDADGLLTVNAQEMISGISNYIEVKPSYGLSDQEIQQMLNDSIANAASDIQLRLYQEAVIEAKALLESVEQAVIADSDLLDKHEMSKIHSACILLKSEVLQEVTDYQLAASQIKSLRDQLNQASAQFAAKRMNKAVNQSLKGKLVDSL